MSLKIKKIINKIDSLNNSLKDEYSKLAEKYGFSVQKRKIVFLKNFKKRNKKFRNPTWKYFIPRNVRYLIAMPFIYGMIIPLVILDIAVTTYNWVALSLYLIPRVKRKDHFIYDRRFLDYLNIMEKINCLYCSYANGLISYSREIAARTERYWCPIKAAHKPKFHHNWYKYFADYGSPEEWKEKFNDPKAFNEANQNNEND